MQKLKNRVQQAELDIYDDIAKIKEALFDTASHMKSRATDALSDSLETARDKTAALQSNVEEYVVEKPIKSLAIAALSGMLLGYLIHSKRDTTR